MDLQISLRHAPTDNRRHIIARGKGYLCDSREYRDWKRETIQEISEQLYAKDRKWRKPMFKPSYTTQIPYRIKIFMASKRTDHTNYLKGLQDVLTQSGVFEDDKYVCPSFEPCEIDAVRPRAVITI